MPQPAPIAFGITDLDVGGAERTFVQLITRLDRSRWSPSVVCLQPEGALGEALRQTNVPVRSLEIRSVGDLPRALAVWRAQLRRFRPVLLQTFLFHANILGRFAGRAAGVSRIVSGVRVAEKGSPWHMTVDRLTHRMADRHLCVSAQVAAHQSAAAGIPRTRLHVVPNGVDLTAADRAAPIDLRPYGARPGRRTLLFLGRLDAQKGLYDLFAALANLQSRRPLDQELLVVLVGAGPLSEHLQEDAARRGFTDLVRFAGWRPRPQDWLAAVDALILPSRWEGMPNVVLEAMAASRPVIATNVEGVAELVVPGETGWIAPRGDVAGLATAIEDFLDRPNLHGPFGAAGRKRVEEHFNYGLMVKRFEEEWRRLLPGRRPSFT